MSARADAHPRSSGPQTEDHALKRFTSMVEPDTQNVNNWMFSPSTRVDLTHAQAPNVRIQSFIWKHLSNLSHFSYKPQALKEDNV